MEGDFVRGLPAQELGDDFTFESDAKSLRQILDDEELPPRPRGQGGPPPGLTPITKGTRKGADRYEFFETKSGAVLFRPKRVNELSGAVVKSGGKRRGFGRTLAEGVTPKKRVPQTERKKSPAPPTLIHRQSISERKPTGRSLLPRPLYGGQGVRKELNFNNFEFAKPEPVQQKPDQKSLAKEVLMRESLAGLPRASLTGLFRQSLTMAELDRMFEDDSTESFENLESRLKTPAKSRKTTKTSAISPKNVEIFEVKVEEEDFDDVNDASTLMKRSKSIGDLLEESAENIVVLPRSLSEENVPSPARKTAMPVGIDTDDPFLREAVENLDRHRQEQAQLDNQLFQLMTQSRKRREDFKAVWGVSPRSINQKRTVKTALNVQNIGFSGEGLFEEYMEEGAHNFTGIEMETDNLSLDDIGLSSVEPDGKVHIDIPLKLGTKSVNIGDMPRQSTDDGTFKGPPTTPMVLRDISNKAQRELAALYSNEDEGLVNG